MDIVYTVKNSPDNDELRYSLRSLINLPHDQVFIVGGCPKFIDQSKVIYLPTQISKTKCSTTTNNIAEACKDKRLSENFILMNDDFYILKKIDDPQKELNLNFGSMKGLANRYRLKYGHHTIYSNAMLDVIRILSLKYNITNPLSFELHIPIIFNKSKFLRLVDLLKKINSDSLHIHKRSVYYNLFENIKDSKSSLDFKIYQGKSFNPEKVKNWKFLSDTDLAWFSSIKNYMKLKFPEKSPYEL